MVRCPKCEQVDDYNVIAILDHSNDDGEYIIEYNAVQCCDCGYHFYIRSFYKWEKDEIVERG